ncbi:hypothetical protein [Polaromonas sp.]|uniref:hypothetical protein n=1 Tax=Polaromonas sp. TaxID=1869339 RepID=UPI003267DED6
MCTRWASSAWWVAALPGETRTIAIAIYEQVQGFNLAAANQRSLLLLLLLLLAVVFSFVASAHLVRRP